jgi:hypothetical protein
MFSSGRLTNYTCPSVLNVKVLKSQGVPCPCVASRNAPESWCKVACCVHKVACCVHKVACCVHVEFRVQTGVDVYEDFVSRLFDGLVIIH